ncbi:NADP-dependent oxidoreductase [Streptomyces sp. CRN 30]|uniref:NADP-dependent oxidoreductase n=1 Tax=Streptomyces sp. CRN 30 TaxID=3075613 RepID=UPI002A80BC97|nr:NADP-dependent oxidoreductase [Streptomyces sp. CRN 30]
MRVVGVTEFGGPEALAVHQVREPHAGPGEVRIDVRAFAVSPTDTAGRAGQQGTRGIALPYVPGMDAAGLIDEVGEGVEGWSVGDEVMAIAIPLGGDHGGAYAEKLVAPVGSFTRVPANTSLEEASTVPMNGLTATQMLEKAALAPGQVLAVPGAAGLLGNYLVQLGRAAGLTVIADAADKDRALVESLGADHVVERGPGFADAVRALVPEGADALADASVQREEALPAVRDGGVSIDVRFWEGTGERGIRFERAVVRDEYRSFDKLDALRRKVEDGVLTPRVAEVLPAAEASQAHRRLEDGGVRGRFVLVW